MKHLKLVLFIFILFFAFWTIHPDTAPPADTQTGIKIHSKILGENRTIRIHLPKNYRKSKKKYPVIYLLDGEWSFDKCKMVVNTLYGDGEIPDVIITAINNISMETRLRDFYQTRVSKYPSSGGADQFLSFIKNEFITYVDNHYRTTSHRVLFGHSSGGYLVVYALLKIPGAFDGFIASSPGLSWDNEVLVKKATNYLQNCEGLKKFLFIAIGSNDYPTYLKALGNFIPLLKTKAPAQLSWKYRYYKNEDHETTPDRSLPDGLKHYFAWLEGE